MEGLEFLLVIAFFTWCGIFIGYQYCKLRIGKTFKREQANELLPHVSGMLPEFNSTEIIQIVEKNRDKCKNYKYDWRSYYNGFLDGFATYFNKHRNYR